MPKKIEISEFLNPNSMVTPGVLGGLVMTITNMLHGMFSLDPRWVSLLLSFLCGAIVFNTNLSKVRAIIFYVLNSLVVLSMANGANALGYAVSNSSIEQPNISIGLATSAYAVDTNSTAQITTNNPPQNPPTRQSPSQNRTFFQRSWY